MKYTRMVCWLDRHERKDLEEENKNYDVPIMFCKNYKEFEKNIDATTFNVFSLKKAKAKRTIKKCLSWLENTPAIDLELFLRLQTTR